MPRRSRNAIVAIKKHPKVRLSAGCESSESLSSSQAANTAIGMGVASDLSHGMRVVTSRSRKLFGFAALKESVDRASEQSIGEL